MQNVLSRCGYPEFVQTIQLTSGYFDKDQELFCEDELSLALNQSGLYKKEAKHT